MRFLKWIVAAAWALLAGCQSTVVPEPTLVSVFATPSSIVQLVVEVRLDGRDVSTLGTVNAVAESMKRVESAAQMTGIAGVRRIEGTRYLVVSTDAAGALFLQGLPDVEALFEDVLLGYELDRAIPLTRLDSLPASTPHGGGATVVIIDSGVLDTHPFFNGRVTGGACFASPDQCDNGRAAQIGLNAGRPCSNCNHGTHVAGIAAGFGNAGHPARGAAPGAYIYPIRVFDRNGTGAYFSDVLAALVHVRDSVSVTSYVTAVNMSLGEMGGGNLCLNQSAMRTWGEIVSQLTNAGISVVAASGNDGFKNRIRFPSCIPGAISVGNSIMDDAGRDNGVNTSSNASALLTVLAPGTAILASIPPASFAYMTGTSMASPLVAGGITALRASVDWSAAELRNALQATGRPVTDAGNGTTYSRVDFTSAWNYLFASAPAAPLIYIKDTGGDTGGQPDPASVGRPLYESPDIWVRNKDDGFTNLHIHQNPEYGQPNFIYARVRNKGRGSSKGYVAAYYVPSGNAALNSGAWRLLGQSFVETAPPMGSTIYKIVWPTLPTPGHYCLLLKWFPEDASATLNFTDMPSAVANDRTLVWRNINIVDATGGSAFVVGDFAIDTTMATNISVEIDRSMPGSEHWVLEIELPAGTRIDLSEPTLKYATITNAGEFVRLRVPLSRGTIYLADVQTPSGPGSTTPIKFGVHRLEGTGVTSSNPIQLRVQQVADVLDHKRGLAISKNRINIRGGVTYQIKP